MSATISFSQLFIYESSNASVRLPLEDLADHADHIHGLLRIELSGQIVPHMGFFGADDVCFNTWIEELSGVVANLGASEIATYIFDEGEQGQPAFAFHREGDLLSVSVVESQLSGASGDPAFQGVSCLWAEFLAAAAEFFACFRAALIQRCPANGQAWWVAHAKQAAYLAVNPQPDRLTAQ